ncbi:MAG: tellurite resistance TerB family protein [Roseinatronobacter sp.]
MIWRFLQRPQPQPARPDGDLALAILLVRAARVDGASDLEEVALIRNILERRFGAERAGSLLAQAEATEAEVGDTVHLTRAIKDLVPLEERGLVLQDLWRIVLSDGRRDPHEDGLMRLVSPLLGLSDRDSALARQDVQRETVSQAEG